MRFSAEADPDHLLCITYERRTVHRDVDTRIREDPPRLLSGGRQRASATAKHKLCLGSEAVTEVRITTASASTEQPGSLPLERLRTIIQDSHLNFLIGAGTPSAFFGMLGDIENALTTLNETEADDSTKSCVRRYRRTSSTTSSCPTSNCSPQPQQARRARC